MKTPFGRQPGPVKFTLEGETEDLDHWFSTLKRLADSRGDDIQRHHRNIFTYYPRAKND